MSPEISIFASTPTKHYATALLIIEARADTLLRYTNVYFSRGADVIAVAPMRFFFFQREC